MGEQNKAGQFKIQNPSLQVFNTFVPLESKEIDQFVQSVEKITNAIRKIIQHDKN
jgi:hypothetical protein